MLMIAPKASFGMSVPTMIVFYDGVCKKAHQRLRSKYKGPAATSLNDLRALRSNRL